MRCGQGKKASPRRTKHVNNRHINRTNPNWASKSKYRKPSQRNKLEDRTMRNPDRTTTQGNNKVLYEKDYGRAIGTNGETFHRVVVNEVLNKITTSFPADGFR